MANSEPRLIQYRNNAQKAAVIFIHGFGGSAGTETWGNFPHYLSKNSALSNWDIFSLGYSSRLSIDFTGFWTANPDIPILALYLNTLCTNPQLDSYESLAFVAHSMGGLVVQQALVDYTHSKSK